MKEQKLWTRDFLSISLSSFFLFLTFYYLLVTLPIYALHDLNGKPSQAGLIVTIFLLAAIVIRPFAGKWIERHGKRIVLISSLSIFALGSLLYYFTNTMNGLFLLRFFHGIGFGMATTAAGAIVADIIPETRRGEGMGYYAMSMNLAMVIGPFLGLTAMEEWGTAVRFGICIFTAFFSLFSGLIIKLPKAVKASSKVMPSAGNKGLKGLFEPTAISIALVAGLFALVYASILSFVSVYAKEIGLIEAASYFFVVYAIVMLIARPFTGRWFDQYGANVIVYPAIICFAAGMVLLSMAETSFTFLLSAALIGLGWGTLFPSFQTIAIQSAEPKRRGLATATFLSIFDIGIGIGSFLVGVITTKIAFSSLYFFSSFFILGCLAVYYLLHGRTAASAKEEKSEPETYLKANG
ncbi:MFS transporter [Bacillus idriensis]|uniref:MFS transporter n=1 Tax=Metabacillus idriensis TaxID=324768 RepID=A0A6I2M9I9_9BACI|nr:MFS transporter [Metabacillus idriensis]MRX54469.1 MFS transporter [Metabacillus idriensis]